MELNSHSDWNVAIVEETPIVEETVILMERGAWGTPLKEGWQMGWGTSNASHSWASQYGNPGSWHHRAPEPKTIIKFKPLPGSFDEWGKMPKAGELCMCKYKWFVRHQSCRFIGWGSNPRVRYAVMTYP